MNSRPICVPLPGRRAPTLSDTCRRLTTPAPQRVRRDVAGQPVTTPGVDRAWVQHCSYCGARCAIWKVTISRTDRDFVDLGPVEWPRTEKKTATPPESVRRPRELPSPSRDRRAAPCPAGSGAVRSCTTSAHVTTPMAAMCILVARSTRRPNAGHRACGRSTGYVSGSSKAAAYSGESHDPLGAGLPPKPTVAYQVRVLA